MSAVQSKLTFSTLRTWMNDRPWFKVAAKMLIGVAAAFGAVKGGTSAVGIALLTGAFVGALILGSIALADYVSRGDSNAERRQRMRSIAIALALGTLTLLFYAATIVRMGSNVLNRPL